MILCRFLTKRSSWIWRLTISSTTSSVSTKSRRCNLVPRQFLLFRILLLFVDSLTLGMRGFGSEVEEKNFAQSINWAHDLFSEKKDASTLVLRHHLGIRSPHGIALSDLLIIVCLL